jgi:hypothetical protein
MFILSMRPLSGATEYGEPERQRKRDAPRRGAGVSTLDGTRSRPLYYSNHASFSIQQVEENVLPDRCQVKERSSVATTRLIASLRPSTSAGKK